MPVTNFPFIQREIVRYGMTTYVAFGLVGNIFNCIMFMRHPYRRTTSSVYFFSFSIFAIIYLCWTVVPFIYMLNNTDPSTISVVYCKLRLYLIHVIGQCLRSLIVFACIDRFFVTRTNARIRSMISISIAKKFVLINCSLWLLIASHMPILTDLRNGICVMIGLYKLIYAMYQIVVSVILPILLMSIFSILTIQSLRHRSGTLSNIRRRDYHLIRIVIAQVMAIIFTSIPYSINLLYQAITYSISNKSTERLEIETFITFVTQFIVFLISVISFYLFLLTSKTFRNDFTRMIFKCWYKYFLRQTQVFPLNERNHGTTNNDQEMQMRQ